MKVKMILPSLTEARSPFFRPDPRFASALFDGMKGMKRLWQAAGTVNSVLAPRLLEKAVESGLRSLFVGFETLNRNNLLEQNKRIPL